jgi:hypothetical protein
MIAWTDRTFIPEVAIHSQVEKIFKMSWNHAITKVAQHNVSPTEQERSKMLVVEYTCLTQRYYMHSEALRVPSFYHDAPAVRQVVHHHVMSTKAVRIWY